MRKGLLITCILGMFLMIGLTACGSSSGGDADYSDSKYVGSWVGTDISLADESEDFGGDYTLTLNADGTGTFDGEGETSSFTWEPTDEGFKTDGDLKTKFTDDGDGIKTSILGVALHFVREGSQSEETEATEADTESYGYTGDDPAVAATYAYAATELSKDYEIDEDTISIPCITVVAEEEGDNGETVVYGDFWINNYKIEGDTLKCVSGGSYPGAMHVVKDGDTYKVTKFDVCEDGGGFDASAKKIFGDYYDAFTKVQSDDKAREKVRKATIAKYVKDHGLKVTKYQDEGWDPVNL